jgi:hypothetical protein
MQWLKSNKEWIFSGIGVAFFMAVVGFIVDFVANENSEKTLPREYTQLSGGDSVNISSTEYARQYEYKHTCWLSSHVSSTKQPHFARHFFIRRK